jgi:hypothetical protein
MAGVSLDARDCFGRGVESYATTTFFLNAAMKEMAYKPVECLQRAALHRRLHLLALALEFSDGSSVDGSFVDGSVANESKEE